jgi:hypothetical protein
MPGSRHKLYISAYIIIDGCSSSKANLTILYELIN